MTINEQIMTALTGIAPIYPHDYTGTDLEYITFRYSAIPANFGDDYPDAMTYAIQVRYCCPIKQNSLSTRKSIRRALATIGTYPTETNMSDSEAQEFVFSFEATDGDV